MTGPSSSPRPEHAPRPGVTWHAELVRIEQLRDSVSALRTIVNRVREAVGTDEPAPAEAEAERYKADYLKACVTIARMHAAATGRSDRGPERGVIEDVEDVRLRAERAEAAIERVRALHRKASHGDTCVYCAHGQRLGYDTTWPCDTIRALGEPFPAAAEATELETTARVLSGLHRSAEEDVTRVIELYERWVKAGPPPLGASLARWWDARLVELHNAIQPADQTTEK